MGTKSNVRFHEGTIYCASLARIRTLGPVKVREFVSFMR